MKPLVLGLVLWSVFGAGISEAAIVTGSKQLTVTAATLNGIVVTAPTASLPVGVSQRYTATGVYSDGSSLDLTEVATWTSSAPSIATVADQGVVTAVQSHASPVQIVASFGGRLGGVNLTVNPAILAQITVSAPAATIPRATTQQYTATGLYTNGSSFDLTDVATWASSAPSIATVAADGLVTGVQSSAVPVQIVAALGGIAGGANLIVNAASLTQITVSAPRTTIPKGISQQYSAVGSYSNGSSVNLTDLVTWASSAPSIASVTEDGLATGVEPNAVPVQIIAVFGGLAGGANLTVNDAIVTAITVTAPRMSVPVGTTQQYTAMGTYSDGSVFDITDLVVWTSSASSIASVNQDGLATGVLASASPVDIVARLDVNRAPTAVLQATPLTGTAPLNVSFSGAQSSDPDGDSIVHYTFTFGDGTPVVQTPTPTFSHLYGAPGTYVATLRVTDSQGNVSTTTSLQIVVSQNQRPSAVLRATPMTGLAPLNVSFSGANSVDPDAGDSIHSYTFAFGDGTPVVQQPSPTISHLYAVPGTYVATLTVRDSQGNVSESTALQIVVVQNHNPTAVLRATPTSGLSPLNVSFNAADSLDPDVSLGDSIMSYLFTFGDGSPVVQQSTPTISHVYGAPGTYIATLRVRDSRGNESAPHSLQIAVTNRAPSAVLSATATTGFAPFTASFSGAQSVEPDFGDRIVSYTFTFGDGSPVVQQPTPTISHLYAAPGTYVATLRVTDSLGTLSASTALQIVVNPNRAPSAILQTTPSTGFAPLSVSFSGAQSSDPDGDSIVRYTFNFGDGAPVVAQPTPTISHVYAASGTYAATLTVMDARGNQSAPVTRQIVVTNSISITDIKMLEGDSGTPKAVFTVRLAAPSIQTVSVRYATRDGSAVAGKDYAAASGTLSFPPGVTSQSVSVNLLAERVFEGDETFFVDLSAPVNAVIGRASATGLIANDDPSVGTTTMTPSRPTMEAGERKTLAVTWIHPVSWRQLQTIDVRIVDDEDIALWVRFRHDQATDAVTFSLFNPASGKFGHPVAPGKPLRLETRDATLYVGESSVFGPPGPSVTLNLRLSLKPRAAGQAYRVEAFATDDEGHEQGFDQVGTLIVRKDREHDHDDDDDDECRGPGRRGRDHDCDRGRSSGR
jgi:PKD repeat protein